MQSANRLNLRNWTALVICVDLDYFFFFFFSSRRRHTRYIGDWSSDVCSSDLGTVLFAGMRVAHDPAQRQHVTPRDVAHEVFDVVVGGRPDEILGRAELHDLAVAHDRDPVAEAERLGDRKSVV